MEDIKTKVCTCCGEEKPVTEFYRLKAGDEGRQSQCKKCIGEKRKKRVNKTLGTPGLNPELEKFTPRQLIEELKARGYKGELRYENIIKL